MAPAVSEVPIMAANPNSINPKASLIDLLQYAYPIILLAFFVICFIARDMLMVSSHAAGKPVEPEKTVCMGPGGRPLPYKHTRNMPLQHIQHFSRPRKLLFDWLSLAIVLSFLAHSVVVILHVLADSAEGYWCGQAVVVRSDSIAVCIITDFPEGLSRWLLHGSYPPAHLRHGL